MKALKKILHCVLLIVTVITSGCTGKNKELSEVEIQETISEQVAIAKEYLANGKNLQGISLLEDLQKQHPNMINTIEALAFAYMDIGDPGLAAFYFEQIRKKAPTLHEYQIFAAQAYMEAKDYPQACRNYKTYLECFPNDRSTWRALGKAYELDKKETLALEAYLRAEDLIKTPTKEQDALRIARLYLKVSNLQEAKTWYHLVLTHNPDSLEGTAKLLKIELQMENWLEAKKHLAKLEGLPGNKVDPALIKVAKDILVKKPSVNRNKTIVAVKETKKAEPDVNAYLKEARDFKKDGEFEKSVESFKKALAMNPKAASIWNELSLAYVGNKDLKAAEQSAKEAVTLEPENLSYTFNYLKIIKTEGTKETLLEELVKAKERFPSNPDVTLTLAQAYHKDGNLKDKAKMYYEEFLLQAPEHAKSEQVRKILASL